MTELVLLTEQEAADYLGLTRSALSAWRTARKGPPYMKLEGSVRYSEAQLAAWARERVVHPD